MYRVYSSAVIQKEGGGEWRGKREDKRGGG